MSLAPPERRLVRLSAAIALGHWGELAALRRSATAGEPDRRWREVVLQAHLFAGFPRVVEAVARLAELGGLGEPEADELGEPRDSAGGERLFSAIYGHNAPAVHRALAHAHPLLERWIAEHAYGRVLARAGLAPDRRELCAVAALAAQGQDRQLAAHARGAVRLGATAAEVRATIEAVADLLVPEQLSRVREVVQHFTVA